MKELSHWADTDDEPQIRAKCVHLCESADCFHPQILELPEGISYIIYTPLVFLGAILAWPVENSIKTGLVLMLTDIGDTNEGDSK